MINLSDFIPGVQVEAPGCPKALMIMAIRNAVREFCDDSRVWSMTLDPISLSADYYIYDIDVPLNTSLVRMTARYNGVGVPVYNSDEMDEEYSSWRDDTGDAVQAVVVDSDTEIRVYPIPNADETDALTLQASLKPSMDATTCDSSLEDWSEAIVHGALRRLKAMPKKPWTDQASVAYHEGEFRKGANEATAKVLRGYSSKSAFIRPQATIE